jgi:hypothetical protein
MLDPERSHIEHPCNSLCEFSDEIVERIADSLPAPLTPRHHELLPNILREWSNNELPRHLAWNSHTEQHKLINKKLEVAARRVAEWATKAPSLNQDERRRWVGWMFKAQGRDFFNQCPSRSELADELQWLNSVLDGFARYAAIEPHLAGPGHPSNNPAYFVIQDAAAIFEWFSGGKPARAPRGPFFRFASVLWPVIFGNGIRGLLAAIRKWADWRDREQSALIGQIAMRHPTWGIFD